MRMRRNPDERGTVLVMAVLLMTVLLTFTAFAVDLGTQRVARRDMQSLSDAVALDLARQLKGRSAATVLADPRFTQVKNQSVQQNGSTVGSTPEVVPVLGTVDNVTGVFTPVSGSTVPTAVKVISSTSVGFAFVPGDGAAARSAIATAADPMACFSVSPTAFTVDSSASRLGPLLDSILRVRLKVLSPNGLLDIQGIEVPLADIAVELGAVTPQALLSKTSVSLRDFVLASATALSNNGHTAQAGVLRAIGLQISGVTVNVAKILSLDTANEAGLDAKINVFDIVTAAIFAANGASSVDVKGLSLNIPGIGGVQELSVTIGEPPQIACGKAGVRARGAQVRVRLKSEVDPLGISASNVLLDIGVELGRGEGTLTKLTCGSPSTAVIRAKSGLATVFGPSTPDNLGLLSLHIAQWRELPGITGSILSALRLLGDRALDVKAQIGADIAQGGPKDLTFTGTTDGTKVPPQSVSATSNMLNLKLKGTKVSVLNGGFLGDLLSAVLDPLLDVIVGGVLTPLINGPVNGLLSAALYPVLNALGIKVAHTDVMVHGNVDCQTVQLVG